MRRQYAVLVVAALALAGCENKAEEAVKRELIDGGSAQFRDVQRCSSDSSIYKGEVNAKNRMGAYVGFEPFFYDGTSVTFAANPEFMTAMNRCYATGAKPVGRAPAAEDKPSPMGAWTTSEDVNPVDDSKTHFASLIAEEGAASGGEPITLTIRCQSNKTELYVNWNDYLGDDSHDVYNDWKQVIVRVGTAEATTQRWGISTDSNATFAPGSPVALIQKMGKADRLVLQTTPYNENPVTAVFKLNGMDIATKQLGESCSWKP
ncbi:type VI secretion system-associated protein TagO [Caulobacter sp. BE254]|uniref:type VI secretion system-associated protein TagO n=1 Tax=Caulobacter sp. BE254 TaxID=2817720 RepID=UPI0028630355|nr:type VI secretion system-associated protein TagO [Caulobacter sp. BE254]MDR7117532.1 hypothetical protein [Caulobacter sp. BE254]